MLKRIPQHRYLAIQTKTAMPENEMERALYVLIHGVRELNKKTPLKKWKKEQKIPEEIKYVYDVYQTTELKSLLESFLLSTVDDYEIYKATGVTVEESQTYRHLFFDTEVFRNDLDIIAFLKSIPDTAPTKELYKIAFHQGFGALRWNYCRDKGEIGADEAMQTILSDSYYQFLSNRGKPLTSKIAKEARDIAKIAISCIQTLNTNKEGPSVGDEEKSLRFMFDTARPNKTVNEMEKDGKRVVH